MWAEMADNHLCSPAFSCFNATQPIGEMLLTQGSPFKDVSEGITVVCVILIQYEDHGEMCHFLDSHSLQLMKVRISMPEPLVHGHQIMKV